MTKDNTRKNAESLVKTVVSNAPDSNGNVSVTASDVGAYSTGEVDTALSGKADKSTTYTKAEVDTALSGKADKSTTYTKAEVDTALSGKADKSTTYTKAEANSLIQALQDEIDQSKQIYQTEVIPNVGTDTSGENRFVKFSRVGNVVEFSIDVTLTSAQNNVDLLNSYPSGYAPMNSGTYLSRTFNTSDDKIPYLWLNPSNRKLFNFPSGRHEIQGVYLTIDPYPAGDEV